MEAVGHDINIGKINYNIFLGEGARGHPPKKVKNWGRGKGPGLSPSPKPPPPIPYM